MAVPEELRDPSLYLTSLEMQELERVFRLVAHFEEKNRITLELEPKVQRRAQLKRHLELPESSGEKLRDPLTGNPMGREDVEREFVLLANECDSLTHRLKAIAARPLEDLRISVADLRAVLAQYGVRFSQAELEEMLWEADDDMDGMLCWHECVLVMQLVFCDTTGLQPARLYCALLFLMFDRDLRGVIEQDDVMEMVFTRYGKERMEEWVRALFGNNETGDRHLTLEDFMGAMSKIISAKTEETMRRRGKQAGGVAGGSRKAAGGRLPRGGRREEAEADGGLASA